jgi:phosphohistidine phosphatase
MAAQLWLLRHGEAVPHESKPDHDRELTARGERQSSDAGAALARLGLEFAACFTSPKVRARDTAARACVPLNVSPEEVASLADGFDRDDAFDLLAGQDDDALVLAVGHEPSFSQVVLDLTGARVDIKKGGMAAIRMRRGAPELLTLLRPREIEALARS